MTITQDFLNNNYYLAVICYLCNFGSPYSTINPATGGHWAFELDDDGLGDGPQPYISRWSISSKVQPSTQTLLDNNTPEGIAQAKLEIYGI